MVINKHSHSLGNITDNWAEDYNTAAISYWFVTPEYIKLVDFTYQYLLPILWRVEFKHSL